MFFFSFLIRTMFNFQSFLPGIQLLRDRGQKRESEASNCVAPAPWTCGQGHEAKCVCSQHTSENTANQFYFIPLFMYSILFCFLLHFEVSLKFSCSQHLGFCLLLLRTSSPHQPSPQVSPLPRQNIFSLSYHNPRTYMFLGLDKSHQQGAVRLPCPKMCPYKCWAIWTSDTFSENCHSCK